MRYAADTTSLRPAAAALVLLQAVLLSCSHRGERRASTPRPNDSPPATVAAARAEVAQARHGMVVAGHPEAAEVGRSVLQRGGSAMDTAVAVSLALGVAEPYGSGLGGKLMMLYWHQSSRRVFAVDAIDQASSTLNAARFVARSYEERTEGWGSVAVPGLLAGMHEGHRRWGRLPWAEVVGPAAELARSGTRVLPQTRKFFERRIDRIRVSEEASRIYLPFGGLPAVGSRLIQPDLARTLEAIAREGPDGFYRGRVAEAIAGASRTGGGSLTVADLASYEARVSEPLRLDFRGVEIVTAPPPASGGATLLAALAALAGMEWSGESLLDPGNLDRIGRVLQRLYPEIQARIADVPSAGDRFYELIGTRPTEPASATSGAGGESESTTHFVVVDSAGNVASATQSLSAHFGAGVVAPGTGVLLNNTAKHFATADPSSVNLAAPAKRPRSTIAPTLVLRDGAPVLAIGVPGGQRIPTATLQVLLDYLVFRTDLVGAICRPRAHLQRPLREADGSNVFELEVADARLTQALQDRGWAIEISDDNETFGGFCAVEILPDRTLVGVADLRRTNAVRGY